MASDFIGEDYEFSQPVTLFYAKQLFEATAIPGIADSIPRYNAHFIMDRDHPAVAELRAIFFRLSDKKFGPGGKLCSMPLTQAEQNEREGGENVSNPGRRHPMHNGDRLIANAIAKNKTEEQIEQMRKAVAGKLVLVGHSKQEKPIRLGGYLNAQARDFLTDDLVRSQRQQFYDGVLVYPKVVITTYDKGLSCTIRAVFSINKGEPLAGGGSGRVVSSVPAGITQHTGHETDVDPNQDEF